jgi:hypothetical protein
MQQPLAIAIISGLVAQLPSSDGMSIGSIRLEELRWMTNDLRSGIRDGQALGRQFPPGPAVRAGRRYLGGKAPNGVECARALASTAACLRQLGRKDIESWNACRYYFVLPQAPYGLASKRKHFSVLARASKSRG